MVRNLFDLVRRAAKKPPRYIVYRLIKEAQAQAERYIAPRRARRITATSLAQDAGCTNVGDWWQILAARPYPASFDITLQDINAFCPQEQERILFQAQQALDHRVNLLGSGVIELGTTIDWQLDYKSGFRWPLAYCHDIQYNNPERPSDVKFPWELSRMQWMIPLGQAFMLTQDERYAVGAKALLDDWIQANPYAGSVNWSCTMEVALRILSWTWFFHVFKASQAWSDVAFQQRFLQMLYLHGDFTVRHLEKSDVNGNHYTADATGLVFAGLFFGNHGAAQSWSQLGWAILCDEMPKQILPDGVNYESSVPYHRLVLELFLLPALYRKQCNLEVSQGYQDQLITMTRYTEAYSRPDGTVPLWGDADDARALPFGGQNINDHRYLLGLVGEALGIAEFQHRFSGLCAEILWLFGAQATAALRKQSSDEVPVTSMAFKDGGFYVLRNAVDHVFIDCGPLGLAGRGGHGHNDLLSFEAVLQGVKLITDSGAYLYTANYQERNLFRSTAYHNTPQIDNEEINRFIRWDYLWNLHNDAQHEVKELQFGKEKDRLVISHNGYSRLSSPVHVVRKIELNHQLHQLSIVDSFQGAGEHEIKIPLHLAPEVSVNLLENNQAQLRVGQQEYSLLWHSEAKWFLSMEESRVSPSYGVVLPAKRLLWQRTGHLASLSVEIKPLS